MYKLVNNNEKYYEFIRILRTDERNIDGFVEKVQITSEQQQKYMSKYASYYHIALEGENPVGWVGQVENDIRICVHPEHKSKGVGKFLLTELMKMYPESKAKVFIDNLASNKLFRSCGFINYNSDTTFNYYIKENFNKPNNNPYKIVKMFEDEIANYTGAKYAVSVDSCTNAIFLSLLYRRKQGYDKNELHIPSKTYLSVPQSVIHAGFEPVFDSKQNGWQGIYEIGDSKVFDAAKRLTSNMYIPETFMCLSFHIKKHLKIGKGGMILTDDIDSVNWFRKARYEGRSEKMYHEDDIDMLGWNMYMTPQEAAHGLALMQNYPKNVPDIGENGGYRDLTEFTIFKSYKKI